MSATYDHGWDDAAAMPEVPAEKLWKVYRWDGTCVSVGMSRAAAISRANAAIAAAGEPFFVAQHGPNGN